MTESLPQPDPVLEPPVPIAPKRGWLRILISVIGAGLILGIIGSLGTEQPEAQPAEPEAMPSASDDPVLVQHTETTAVGVVVKFQLSRDATCSIVTNGNPLGTPSETQDRPAGRNWWAVTDATYASVACE